MIPNPSALPPLRSALADPDEEVAAAAARALGRRADRGAEAGLVRLLASGRPRAKRAAAEALADCGGPGALPAVWGELAAGPDEFLGHALIGATHRIADADALLAALVRPEPAVQAAALRLLDQPPRPRGRLRPGPVVERLGSSVPSLRGAALWALGRHPEWSGAALDHLRGRLGEAPRPDEAPVTDLVLAFQDRADVQALLAEVATDASAPAGRRAWALETMARTRLAPLPGPWVEALAASLRGAGPPVRRAAVRAAAVVQAPRLDALLRAIADDPAEPPEVRLDALRATLAGHPEPSSAAFDLLLERLASADDSLGALAAAELAGRSRLDDGRRLRLLDAVRGRALVTPPMLRAAFAPPIGERAASAWVAYLEATLDAGWRPAEAELQALLEAVPALVDGRRAALLRLAAGGDADRRARLAEFEPLLTGGDPGRGRAVFFGKAAACGTCHRVGDAGGRVGPDLTGIGSVRSGRDLLESILWPSSTFAQGYEPFPVATADGRVLPGLVARQDAAVLVLRDASGAETRLRRDEVEALRRSGSSLMPDGLARALTRQELRDLLAFLQSRD